MMTWAYIAGFFDGEGSIVIRSGQHGAFRLQVVQSKKNGGEAVLLEIASFLEKSGVHAKVYHAKDRDCPMFVLYIGQLRSIGKFLKQTFPYLRVKRGIAQDVIRYATLFPSYRDVGVHRGFSTAKGIRHPWVSEHLKGNHLHGAKRKLTPAQAEQIKSMKGTGVFQKEVASQFKISRATVEMIWLGKRW